jgi:hypothetical protein
LNYTTGEYVLPIRAFTAAASCGNAVWKYSIADLFFSPLFYVSDLLGCDFNSGSIKVNTNKAAGIYNIKIIGTLPDQTTLDENFIITIAPPNQPPRFSSALSA